MGEQAGASPRDEQTPKSTLMGALGKG